MNKAKKIWTSCLRDQKAQLWLFGLLMTYLFAGSGCTGMKHISEKDPLFTGSEVIIKPEKKLSLTLKDQLKNVNRPKPNGKLLWMRPSIAVYNMMGTPRKEKGLRHWIKNRIGRPPVLASDVSPENVSELMKNRFFNQGFFNTKVSHQTDTLNRRMQIKYLINSGDQYQIKSIDYLQGGSEFEETIEQAKTTSEIKAGGPYVLDNLKSERRRIETLLKDSGFYYFDKELLIFRADTSGNQNQVNLQLALKPSAPPQALQKTYLNEIFIFDDFQFDNYDPDTILYQKYHYISDRHIFRKDIVSGRVHLRPGDLYSGKYHLRTLNQLSDLGIYRFINIDFREDSTTGQLNTFIYAVPLKKSSLTAELNGTIKTTNYVGPGAKISWRHRNVFGGAEELSVNILGSFEVQVGIDSINTAFEGGLEADLKIPRPLIFKGLLRNKEFIPRTNILAGYNLYRRVELYSMNSFYVSFGYSWRKSQKVSHILNPVDLRFSRVTDQTEAFRDYLENNPTVKVSFEEQFIIGSSYAFTYDNLQDPYKRSTGYFRGIVDFSGNLTNLLFETFSGRESTPDNPYRILGVPFSQYIIFNPEFRHYWKTGRKGVLATRLLLGLGIPMGNSRVLPYIKQFYAGGTNGVRAFVARSLGPGSYKGPVENLGVDQTGDLRIEVNAEYRFNFSKRLLGALFLDAGNVWLRNPDSERPGGDFQLNRFYKEIGVGTGFGFRFDLQVLVLRMDLAWPLYVPYLDEKDRWVINEIDFFSRDWRKQFLILNIAIGYPF